MAAAGSGSRWSGLGQGLIPESATTVSPFVRQSDQVIGTGVISSGQVIGNGQSVVRTALVEQRVNTVDPSFYDCFYGIANTQSTVVERCYKDIGCCQFGCCHNHDWHTKYGWAVALIVIFCILVVIAVAIWLIVWLINRAKDKREKRDVMYDRTSFASQTPMPGNEIVPIEQYTFEPPYSRDYRY